MTSITIHQTTAIQSDTQLTIEYVPPKRYPTLKKVVLAWKTFASNQQTAIFESLLKIDDETLGSSSSVYRNNTIKNIDLFADSAVVCELIALDALNMQSSFLVYQCIEASSQSVEGVIVLSYNPEKDANTMYVKDLVSNPKNLRPATIDNTQKKVSGVGAMLLQHAEEVFIQKKESLSGSEKLWVTAFKGACAFYKRQGFTEAQSRPGAFTQQMYKNIADVTSSTFLQASGD